MPARRLSKPSDLPAANRQLAAEIADRLQIKANTLPEAMARGKSHLSQKILLGLQNAVDAESWLSHPQMFQRIDLDAIRRSHSRTRAFLSKVDLKRSRERYWLGIAAGLFVNFVLLGVCLVFVLRWRGFL